MVLMAKIEEYVEIPKDVKVSVRGMDVTVSGKNGEIKREFKTRETVHIDKEGEKLKIWTLFPKRRTRAMIGTIKAHIENMIIGVTKGYRYKLKIYYRHFPMNVSVDKNTVVIRNFLGEKHPRYAPILDGVNVKVKGKEEIIVEGIDRERVGQTAANIEQATLIKDKDPRVFVDGIYIVEKGVKNE